MHRALIHGLNYEPDYWSRYELHYDPRYVQSNTAMHAGVLTNDSFCATPPFDKQTYNAGYILMQVEAPPLVPAAGSNDPKRWAAGDQARSAEVCYTARLDNAGCAIRLHR